MVRCGLAADSHMGRIAFRHISALWQQMMIHRPPPPSCTERESSCPETTETPRSTGHLIRHFHRIGAERSRCAQPRIATQRDLTAYTPGVARVSSAIAAEPELAYDYTWKANTVLVVTDGTAVLGLGDIGPVAALPVMEGKALLFKEFAGVDAVPICLTATKTEDVIETPSGSPQPLVASIWRTFQPPGVSEIERRPQDRLDIPVFHDDQHGNRDCGSAALS